MKSELASYYGNVRITETEYSGNSKEESNGEMCEEGQEDLLQ